MNYLFLLYFIKNYIFLRIRAHIKFKIQSYIVFRTISISV